MAAKQDFINAGYNAFVSEALAERGFDVDVAKTWTLQELVNEVLEWNGIIGFTSTIFSMIDNLQKQGHE